ncbi:hypothetical protein T08_14768 [Trichinella sp. T8]|nr:hypothetical protein T08_14768 [Trichinella sp. T8]
MGKFSRYHRLDDTVANYPLIDRCTTVEKYDEIKIEIYPIDHRDVCFVMLTVYRMGMDFGCVRNDERIKVCIERFKNELR